MHRAVLLAFSLLLAGTVAQAQQQPAARDAEGRASHKEVDTSSHSPYFAPGPGGYPSVQCAYAGGSYIDSIWVTDKDLAMPEEWIALRVLSPQGFSISPGLILGPQPSDTLKAYISAESIPTPFGRRKVVLEARDRDGNVDTIGYDITVSAKPLFSMPLLLGAINTQMGSAPTQTLTFGIGEDGMATTGFETDSVGRLDPLYCEHEVPPIDPDRYIFDARWFIPSTGGTLRSIYPAGDPLETPVPAWICTLNVGGGWQGGPAFLLWSMSDAARFPFPLRLTDKYGTLFHVDMSTGQHHANTGIEVRRLGGDTMRVMINLTTVTELHILRDTPNDLPPDRSLPASLELTAFPIPFRGSTTIGCRVPTPGDLRLEIVDCLGERVRTLMREKVAAGEISAQWEGTDDEGNDVPDGIYFCVAWIGEHRTSTAIVVAR